MNDKVPRVVLITRRTELEELLLRHGTRDQARFFLGTRELTLREVESRHERFQSALGQVKQAIPLRWRRSRVDRADLDRFLFEPEDIVVAVGQDGLVANAAKYLDGQAVIGIDPDPDSHAGILVPHPPDSAGRLLAAVASDRVEIEERCMVEARLDDSQRLLALNEIFIGHRTHQSARYAIRWHGHEEYQSSSGIIVSTGTGATGWAMSIHRQSGSRLPLPGPAQPELVFFVREAFPSAATRSTLVEGLIPSGESLAVTSRMNDRGVIFGDGIEDDRIEFPWGVCAQIGVASSKLRLVQA
ncbi:MAG: NAD(+)/NADH kinase [Deltaproteobacteria bacterium]|nr:NAD(+)/NADH kinase [Deltaproteobacteria bacterium]